MKKSIVKPLLLGFLIIYSLSEVAAQGRSNQAPGIGGNPPSKNVQAPGNKKPTGVPIDGGAGILLAAGAAYGLKKLRDYRINNKSKH